MHVDQNDEHSWLRVEKEVLRAFLARGTPVTCC
jgi:hypothetical protein